MSDDEEFEAFDISESDYKYAMNPSQRKRNKMSKEEAMLGIWASRKDSSDEDADFVGFDDRGRKSSKVIKSSSINFISGGIKGEEKKKKAADEDMEIDEDEIMNKDDFKTVLFSKKYRDSDEEIEEVIYKEPAKKRLKEKTTIYEHKFKGKHEKSAKKDVGDWEKHTKGIGSKLLQKMGWKEGMGIGKDLQGRAEPVEAKVRQGKGAVGMYGAESVEVLKAKKEAKEKKVRQKEQEEEMEREPQWKKKEQTKKPKYVIKSADDLLIEGRDEYHEAGTKHKPKKSILSGLSTSKIKIIDLTGREEKVFEGYESLSRIRKVEVPSQTDKREFNVPELIQNLDTLISMKEDEIFDTDRKLKYHEDMVITMSQEEKRINEKLDREKKQIDSSNEVLQIIDKCEKELENSTATLDFLTKQFKSIKMHYYNEYKMYNLSELSISFVKPMVDTMYAKWDPLNNLGEMKIGYEVFLEWRALLEDSKATSTSHNGSKKPIDPYHRLIWEAWMPHLRRVIFRHTMRKCDVVIDFFESWYSLLPHWIVDEILHEVILKKIKSDVEEWNPLADTVPIHAWILPWLPILKERLAVVYPIIRFKLANALTNWHPSDDSAKAILMPWKNIFSQSTWDSFMVANILPKLTLALQNFTIDRRLQNLEPWKWVMKWEDLIASSHFVDLIDSVFFPKWLQELSIWLNSSPNLEEVSRWYVAWKANFSPNLTSSPVIKSKLTSGLMMMNQSANGQIVSYKAALQQSAPVPAAPSATKRLIDSQQGVRMTATPTVTSFKDIVERKAAESNLLFMPVKNRFVEGKQVYRLGSMNVYVDKNVIFSQHGGQWRPQPLSDVIQQAL